MAITLTVNQQAYRRWTSVRVTRGLKRACAIFEIETPGEIDPPILPFASCVLSDDGDPVITGYVDEVRTEIGAHESRTRISGRSKTADLVDCMLEAFAASTNQFNNSDLGQIARAVAAPFGIGVVVGPGVNVGDPFPDATFEWCETAFRFLNRLARQRGVMLTDDPAGNLVLATLGTAAAPAALATGPGGNVFAASGVLSGARRFATYTIRSQAGMQQTGEDAETSIVGQGADAGVPRYRPWAGIAESALLAAEAQQRAVWEGSHRLGEGISVVLSVPEWRAGPGAGQLWRPNQLVHCTVPRLDLIGQMLIGAISFLDDGRGGRRTELTVAPPSAFSPQPLPTSGTDVPGVGWPGITQPAPGAAGMPSGSAGPSPASVSSSRVPLT